MPTEEARRATGPRFTRGTRKRAGPCPCRPEACTEGPKHSEGSEVRRPVPSLRPTSETVRRWREGYQGGGFLRERRNSRPSPSSFPSTLFFAFLRDGAGHGSRSSSEFHLISRRLGLVVHVARIALLRRNSSHAFRPLSHSASSRRLASFTASVPPSQPPSRLATLVRTERGGMEKRK